MPDADETLKALFDAQKALEAIHRLMATVVEPGLVEIDRIAQEALTEARMKQVIRAREIAIGRLEE